MASMNSIGNDNMSLGKSTDSHRTPIESSSSATFDIVLKVEAPLAERRRSSNISFEKHSLFFLEHFYDLSEDEDSDNEGEKLPVASKNDCCGNPQDDHPMNCVSPEDRSGYYRENGTMGAARRSASLLGEVEDDIIAKGVADGKLSPIAPVSTAPRRNRRSGGGGNRSRAGFRRISFASGESSSIGGGVRRDIDRALAELLQEERGNDDEDFGLLDAPSSAGARAVGSVVAVIETVLYVPPPAGARPRRSSFKRRDSYAFVA